MKALLRSIGALVVVTGGGCGSSGPEGGPDAGLDLTECGIPLVESGNLDLDLPAIRVTGTITLDGAALPSASYARPRIEVRAADGSTGVLVDLQRAPSGQYDVQLLPGTYDVLYTELAAACTGTPYPCQERAVIRAAVEIRDAGALDLDIPTVRVTGRATLDGATPPSAPYPRPVIGLRGADGSTGVLVDLERVPGGQYDVRVVRGTYDVLYTESAPVPTCSGSPYPCQEDAVVRPAVSFQASGNLDLDVRTVTVSGRVTLDHAALPSAITELPRLELRGADGSTGTLVYLEDHPTGQYEARVLSGTYDVTYAERDSQCTGLPYPCQQGAVVKRGVQLAANGVLDVDLATVGVSGRVTLDGGPPPPISSPPVIELRGGDDSTGVLVDLSKDPDGAYQVRVLAGTYDLLYSETSTLCLGTRWPCQQHRIIRPGVALQATGVLDLDVAPIVVQLRVTLDGAAPPAAGGAWPELEVRGDDGSTGTLFSLRHDADGTYEARLLAGTYDLLYTDTSDACPGSPWPCQQRAVLQDAVAITASGALDVDIPTIGVSGRVTLAGAALPPATYPLPLIALAGQERATGTLVDLARAPTGAYQARLVPGRYVVAYDEPIDACTGEPYPCQRARAIKGCGSTP